MIVIKLSWPDSRLMPNKKNGKHWSSTNAAKVSAKEAAYYATKQAIGAWKSPDGTIPLSIVFCPPDRRRRDLDNLLASAKSQIDGMAQALGVDDALFRPVLLDVGPIGKPGAMIVAVGVKIVTEQDLG